MGTSQLVAQTKPSAQDVWGEHSRKECQIRDAEKRCMTCDSHHTERVAYEPIQMSVKMMPINKLWTPSMQGPAPYNLGFGHPGMMKWSGIPVATNQNVWLPTHGHPKQNSPNLGRDTREHLPELRQCTRTTPASPIQHDPRSFGTTSNKGKGNFS